MAGAMSAVPFPTNPFADLDVGFSFLSTAEIGSIVSRAEEQAMLSPRAKREIRDLFTLGREAARRALSHPDNPTILRVVHREPRWPEHYCGSISHSERDGVGFGVSVAARQAAYSSMGVDLENLRRPISPALIKRIARGVEFDWIHEQAALVQRRAITLFSAKETLFKAFFPLYRKTMLFQSSILRKIPEGFEVDIHPPAGIDPFSCRVLVGEQDDWVLSATFLPLYLLDVRQQGKG